MDDKGKDFAKGNYLDQLVIDTLNELGEKMAQQLNDLGVTFEHGKEINEYIKEGIEQWAGAHGYGDDVIDAFTIMWCVITLVKSHVNFRDKSKDS